MNAPITLALAAGMLLSAGSALAADPTPDMRDNPFATASTLPYQLPPFDKIHDSDFAPAFAAGMAAQRAEIDAIANNPERPSFDNTIVAMEKSGAMLARVSSVFFNLTSSNTNETLEKLQADVAPRLAAHSDAIYLDARLYARVRALYNTRRLLDLDPQSERLLERYHTRFVRAGADLDDAQKEKLRHFNEQLSQLSTQFEQNLLKGTAAAAVVVDTRAELDGMSDAEISTAAEAAKSRGLDGKYVITLQNTTGQPALAHLKSRALREKIYQASVTRCSHGSAFDNTGVIKQIVLLSAQRAALLGYPSHAAYVLEDETAKTPEAVNKMLAQLVPAAVANVHRDLAEMQKLADAEHAGYKLAAWDWAYYAEKLRKAKYDFDESQMKPYLELDDVLQNGLFYEAHELYGLTFKERTDLPVYHPDVRVFEVFDKDGSRLALFLTDYYKRDSKNGGAWMNEYVSQSDLLGTRPVVVNNLNIPKPAAGQPTLLTFDEVTTMFHEFGHALHGMFSDVKYPYFAGTAVPRDFVEYPSQFNEMWATDPDVLKHYAKHYKTGAPMPRALLDKVMATQKYGQGFTTTEYLEASIIDQSWYQLPVADAQVADVSAFESKVLHDAGIDVPEVPPRYHSPYFAHAFSLGYDAGYYAYIWSAVLDTDTAQWFRQHGGLKRESGERFRAMLLSKGGSVDASTLFHDFIGHDPDIQPLLDQRGLVLPKAAAKPN
ncbi:M3 family metallopeptidase [Solimonas terrae]|uniref:Dipeptidyl carboxypeptidase n=1 Tax=Solimonas terrae TaxID=1396819 RepID=A0A6M2BQR5_9GAMM|nr:M3 family metallopeptidase [Solimonas terrae]NGY04694.1 M3 family metallopeptidase [Solimonas terrae]